MDAIFCSSRGGGLSEPLLELHPYPSTVYLYSKGGGTLERLQHEAYSFLDNTLEPTNCHIYFVAGLCDVTYKDTDCEWGGYYEEVFYCESPWETAQRLGKSTKYLLIPFFMEQNHASQQLFHATLRLGTTFA